MLLDELEFDTAVPPTAIEVCVYITANEALPNQPESQKQLNKGKTELINIKTK